MIEDIRKILQSPSLSMQDREHLLRLSESMIQLQEENSQLYTALSALQQEVVRMEEEHNLTSRQKAEFVQYNDAHFKREATTGCFIGPYCKHCLRTMESYQRNGYWCVPCGAGPSFSRQDLGSILAIVNKVYG